MFGASPLQMMMSMWGVRFSFCSHVSTHLCVELDTTAIFFLSAFSWSISWRTPGSVWTFSRSASSFVCLCALIVVQS